MKLRGEFVVRKIMDNTVAVPVGQTALQLNGMILLNDVIGDADLLCGCDCGREGNVSVSDLGDLGIEFFLYRKRCLLSFKALPLLSIFQQSNKDCTKALTFLILRHQHRLHDLHIYIFHQDF